ncbi:hypothetical protein CEXT_242371 [Caerostris extrusa]|uniref:Uncharacterized protein n=1 Tax=Caerostris extrusa TaxID=172846 RepID=A0AAV4Y9F4_CAEEX|nr:hypothetical protein CEXT_242371 [Caerostris extrusa]
MKNLGADFIEHDVLKHHSLWLLLSTSSFTVPNLTPDCRPVTSKSRYQTEEDRILIAAEVKKFPEEENFESSKSHWCAQPFVVKGEHRNHVWLLTIRKQLTAS